MAENRKPVKRWAVAGALFLACLMIAGIASRPAAIASPSFYALHAVLVAPFNAAFLAFFLGWAGSFAPLGIAACAFGLALGAMSPVMGVGIVVPVACSLAAWALLRRSAFSKRCLVSAAVFGAAGYPAAFAAGAAVGSVALSDPQTQLVAALMTLLGAALAVLGALGGRSLAARLPFAKERSLP